MYLDNSGMPVPSRGTSTDRQTRSGSKGLMNSGNQQYYMMNNQAQTAGNMIPSRKKVEAITRPLPSR